MNFTMGLIYSAFQFFLFQEMSLLKLFIYPKYKQLNLNNSGLTPITPTHTTTLSLHCVWFYDVYSFTVYQATEEWNEYL